MCLMCDGGTWDDVVENIERQIDAFGFGLMPVLGSPAGTGWVYSIGLLEHHGHPELVAVAVRLREAEAALATLANALVRGDRFTAGGDTVLLGARVQFGKVDPSHFRRGLINGWMGYYEAQERWDMEPEFLQVVLPAAGRCCAHQRSQPQLSLPGPVSFATDASWKSPEALRR